MPVRVKLLLLEWCGGSVLVGLVDEWIVAGALIGLSASAGQCAWASAATGPVGLDSSVSGQSGASCLRISAHLRLPI